MAAWWEKDSMQDISLDVSQSPYIEYLQLSSSFTLIKYIQTQPKTLQFFFWKQKEVQNISIAWFRKDISMKEWKLLLSSMSVFYWWISNTHFPLFGILSFQIDCTTSGVYFEPCQTSCLDTCESIYEHFEYMNTLL